MPTFLAIREKENQTRSVCLSPLHKLRQPDKFNSVQLPLRCTWAQQNSSTTTPQLKPPDFPDSFDPQTTGALKRWRLLSPFSSAPFPVSDFPFPYSLQFFDNSSVYFILNYSRRAIVLHICRHGCQSSFGSVQFSIFSQFDHSRLSS